MTKTEAAVKCPHDLAINGFTIERRQKGYNIPCAICGETLPTHVQQKIAQRYSPLLSSNLEFALKSTRDYGAAYVKKRHAEALAAKGFVKIVRRNLTLVRRCDWSLEITEAGRRALALIEERMGTPQRELRSMFAHACNARTTVSHG